MNMVQVSRVAKRHTARREEILRVARAAVEAEGLDGLTIKGLAVELDCAVGTLYTYFPSKAALVAAMQADAIRRLGAAYAAVAERLEPEVLRGSEGERPLARLVLFGRSAIASERHLPDEVHLQQRLLTTPGIFGSAEYDAVTGVAFEVLARPQGLLAEAVAQGALRAGDAFDRTLRWIAATSGVLLLRGIQHPGAGVFDTRVLADDLTTDLLLGWGADADLLAAAAARIPFAAVDDALTEVLS